MERTAMWVLGVIILTFSSTQTNPALAARPANVLTPTSNQTQQVVVVDLNEPGIEVVGDSVFFPTGEISDSTKVVLPEVESYLRRGSDSGESARANPQFSFYAPPGGAWVGPYTSNVGFIGLNDESRQIYSWGVIAGTNQQACLEGIGFYRGYNGSSFSIWSRYYSLGCGQSNAGSVPWGNTMALPSVRARSMSVIHIANGWWT